MCDGLDHIRGRELALDYIIFGIGSGATLVLAGWLLRNWGPRLRDRQPKDDQILSASNLVMRMAWTRFCATCGTAMLICGILVMLVTLGATLLAPSDTIATAAVLVAFGLACVLMMLWSSLYVRQFGTAGVVRPREKPAPAEVPATPSETALEPEAALAEVAADIPAPSRGLSRFTGRFRKTRERTDDPDAPVEPPAEQPSVTPEDAPDTPILESPMARTVSTVVVTQQAPEASSGDDKALDPTDPLVTSIAGSTEAIPEDSPMQPSETQTQLSPAVGGDAFPATDSEQEQALSQLRRRRVSRLSSPPEPD